MPQASKKLACFMAVINLSALAVFVYEGWAPLWLLAAVVVCWLLLALLDIVYWKLWISELITDYRLRLKFVHVLGGVLLVWLGMWLGERALVALIVSMLLPCLLCAPALRRNPSMGVFGLAFLGVDRGGKPLEAPTYAFSGMLLAYLISPYREALYASILVLSLGDGAAALVGRRLGKHPIPFNPLKSIEGTVACFTLAFLGASLVIDPLLALGSALVGALVEALPIPPDDNLNIPVAVSLFLQLSNLFC